MHEHWPSVQGKTNFPFLYCLWCFRQFNTNTPCSFFGSASLWFSAAVYFQPATPFTVPHLYSASQNLAAGWFARDSSNMCSFVGTDVFGGLGILAHDALCNGSHFQDRKTFMKKKSELAAARCKLTLWPTTICHCLDQQNNRHLGLINTLIMFCVINGSKASLMRG